MPKVELYINLQLCDLTGSEQIEVDYTSFDISKIGTRGGARSYSFNLPKTNLNKAVLENPEIVNNLSTLPYTRLPCRILVDGIDVQIRFAEIESAKDVYAVRVYGANSDLFATLKNKKLPDLDLTEFDHYWNFLNTINSRINTNGYIYPIIDWQNDSPNSYINNDSNHMRVEYMLPCVFINTILSKIFEEAGYTLENEAEEDSEQMILTSFRQPKNNLNGKKYIGVFGLGTSFFVGAGAPFPVSPLWETYVNYDWLYWQLPLSQFVIPELCDIDWSVTFQAENTNAVTAIQLTVRIERPNTLLFDDFVYTIPPLGFITDTISYSVIDAHNLFNPDSQGGYIIGMAFWDDAGGQVKITTNTFLQISKVNVKERLDTSYGQYLSLSGILPEITYIEFFKAYMQLFCLVPIVISYENKVRLVKFSQIVSKLHLAYDWSDKVDYSEQHEARFIVEGYARENNFAYEQDAKEIKPIGADGTIVINNENLEQERTLVELPYAATNDVTRLIGQQVNIIPIFEDGEFREERVPRILIMNKKTSTDIGEPVVVYEQEPPVQSVNMNTSIPFTYFIDNSKDLSLGFDSNILELYYGLISKTIVGAKLIIESVRLSAADISTIDFTRPVWIQKHEAYFYISSIKGFSYTENKSTIVELVKLNING